MLRRLCAQPSKLYLAVTSALWAVALLCNYFLGTERITEARASQFSGGLCGSCEACPKAMASCSEWAGFDFNYLIVTVVLLGLAVGLYNGLRHTSFTKSIIRALYSAGGFIILTELLVQLLQIPVLYTHFMEGRQTLFYRFLLTPDTNYIEINVYLSFAVLIFGIVGNLVGVMTHTVWRVLRKTY